MPPADAPTAAAAPDWALLKAVSRSFFLTLRLLPGEVRDSISLAYLLARLSDTEADGAGSTAEEILLARRAELEASLRASPDRGIIEKVWTTIRAGQQFDRTRFGPGSAPLSEKELDWYTYHVAGCVGEFWTEICARHLPGFASRPAAEMEKLGVRFGQGLQLVNILRDRAADARMGRVYVAAEGVAAGLARARSNLDAAEDYCRALRGWRLRAACALPMLLGRETLRLVEAHPDAARVKVSRTRVWMLLVAALAFRQRAH